MLDGEEETAAVEERPTTLLKEEPENDIACKTVIRMLERVVGRRGLAGASEDRRRAEKARRGRGACGLGTTTNSFCSRLTLLIASPHMSRQPRGSGRARRHRRTPRS